MPFSLKSIFLLFFHQFAFSTYTGGNKGDSCSNCCQPSDPGSNLALAIYTPVIVVTCIILPIIALIIWKFFTSKSSIKSFSEVFPFKGQYPEVANYQGYFYLLNEWKTLPEIQLSFSLEEIKGMGADSIGSYEWKANLKQIPISFSKKYLPKNENESHPNIVDSSSKENLPYEAETSLLSSHFPKTSKPAFIGKYFIKNIKKSGLCFFIPSECKLNPQEFFTPTYLKESRFFWFILLIINSALMIYWFITLGIYDHQFSGYADLVVGFQWQGIFSLFGLFLVLISRRSFFYSIPEIGSRIIRNLVLLYIFCLLGVILAFGMMDLMGANFLIDFPIYPRNFDFSSSDSLKNNSCFSGNNYKCAAIWAGLYEKRDETCLNKYKYVCYTFDSKEDSCDTMKSNISNYLITSSILSLGLFFFWMIFFMGNLYRNCNVWGVAKNKIKELYLKE